MCFYGGGFWNALKKKFLGYLGCYAKLKCLFLKKNEGRVEEFERKDKTVEIK